LTPHPEATTSIQVRVARHTERLPEVVAFYRDGIGLREVGGFRDHDGYDGVFLEIPGSDAHLEFTTGGEHGAHHGRRARRSGTTPRVAARPVFRRPGGRAEGC
jgi:hypothetical protein